MSIEESGIIIKKGRRSPTHHGEPRNPVMVLAILHWRDNLKKTWQEIGDEFNMTRAGARHMYHKWRDWSKEQMQSTGT